MEIGQKIRVMEAFENISIKRIVSADHRNLYVCTEEEFELAKAENREPISIGFGRQYVLGILDEGR
jgi:hypothetical protein